VYHLFEEDDQQFQHKLWLREHHMLNTNFENTDIMVFGESFCKQNCCRSVDVRKHLRVHLSWMQLPHVIYFVWVSKIAVRAVAVFQQLVDKIWNSEALDTQI
jgi:hypothetical protein